MQVDVTVVDDELLALAAEHPEGLVELRPAVRVVARAPAPAASAAPATLDPRIPVDGSRVRATGFRQDVGGEVRLCSRHVLSWQVTSELPCAAGIAVQGLGAATGDLTVVATLRDEVLVVERTEPAPALPRSPGLPEVPCPTPPGGWPDGGAPYDERSPDERLLAAFTSAHPGLTDEHRVMMLRPARDRQVVTVLVRDEAERAQVEAELARSFPGRTCVLVEEQDLGLALRASSDHRLDTAGQLGEFPWGPQLRSRSALMRVLRLTEPALAAQASYPPGVLVLEPFLEVVPED
jgi:hypothetical protein